jgi:hypothetical protein
MLPRGISVVEGFFDQGFGNSVYKRQLMGPAVTVTQSRPSVRSGFESRIRIIMSPLSQSDLEQCSSPTMPDSVLGSMKELGKPFGAMEPMPIWRAV